MGALGSKSNCSMKAAPYSGFYYIYNLNSNQSQLENIWDEKAPNV